MANFFEIPLSPQPQSFAISLNGVSYNLTLQYRNTTEGGWVLDIADATKKPIVQGIPLVTGVDLLAQYKNLNFGGRLWVQTGDNPDAVPTFLNLGTNAHLYWVTG